MPGKENHADELAMNVISKRSALWRLMKKNVLNMELIGWAIKRDGYGMCGN